MDSKGIEREAYPVNKPTLKMDLVNVRLARVGHGIRRFPPRITESILNNPAHYDPVTYAVALAYNEYRTSRRTGR